MKYLIAFFIALATTVFLISCSTPVYVEKDDSANLNNYKTYMWVETRTSETDNNERSTSYADISVHNAVNSELKKLGWREVSENPDALISFDILVERTTESKSDAVYSRPFSRMFYNPYTRRWSTIYYPSQFMGYQNYEVPVKEGTISVTIIDAKSDKSIWQGWTTENMNYSRFTGDEISRSIRNIFKKFDNA